MSDAGTAGPVEPMSETTPAPPPPPASRNWNPILLVGLVLALAIVGLLAWLVLTSRGGTGPLSETHTIEGSLSAPECAGGYEIENASVEVRDQNDKLIGAATTSGNTNTAGSTCLVTFTITDVPKASFYQVRIGSHDGPTYTYDEMKSFGWKLALSLGG